MMSFDLNVFSVADLNKLTISIEKELKARKGQILKDARAEVREIEKKYDLAIEDILATKLSKSVEPKYRNPNNSEETWTGRGKKPLWIETLLSQGTPIEHLMI
jgi:DNA-binding protein H-NS